MRRKVIRRLKARHDLEESITAAKQGNCVNEKGAIVFGVNRPKSEKGERWLLTRTSGKKERLRENGLHGFCRERKGVVSRKRERERTIMHTDAMSGLRGNKLQGER